MAKQLVNCHSGNSKIKSPTKGEKIMAQTKIIYEKFGPTGKSTCREVYSGNISEYAAQRMLEQRHPGCTIVIIEVIPQ